jgi:hypothetical protein
MLEKNEIINQILTRKKGQRISGQDKWAKLIYKNII